MPMSTDRRIHFDGTKEYLESLNQQLQDKRYEGLDEFELQERLLGDIQANSTSQQRSWNKWITGDPKMMSMKDRILKIAGKEKPILITGPTGTGKGLLARSLLTDGRPFVVATCGGLPDSLVPSLFFGYQRGAFTGAIQDRDGYLVAAKNGIVLLDEIGDLPMHLQATLLHAIQSREVYPVGSVVPKDIQCRFVATTNYNLEERIAEKLFRRDLLARISVFHIELSGLCDRPGDIELIARSLGYNGDLPFPPRVVERIALENVRAIENAIERWKTYGEFD